MGGRRGRSEREGGTFEARGVISMLISLPSSSFRGFARATVCRLGADDEKALLPCVVFTAL